MGLFAIFKPVLNIKLAQQIRILFCLISLFSATVFTVEAQTEISRSQRRELRKDKKHSFSEYQTLEKNYISRQTEHYKHQDRETRRMMRKGQKQARKQAKNRTTPWWKRVLLRRK